MFFIPGQTYKTKQETYICIKKPTKSSPFADIEIKTINKGSLFLFVDYLPINPINRNDWKIYLMDKKEMIVCIELIFGTKVANKTDVDDYTDYSLSSHFERVSTD